MADLRDRLIAHDVHFVIEPYIRFAGEVGEQANVLIRSQWQRFGVQRLCRYRGRVIQIMTGLKECSHRCTKFSGGSCSTLIAWQYAAL